jgi:Skp family chaperone for outer membrane proteins
MNIMAFLSVLYTNRLVIGIVSLAFVILSCFAYYKYTTVKIEMLEQENARLVEEVEAQKRVIQTLKQNYENLVKTKDDLSREIDDIRRKEQEEIDKISREQNNKKSLEELALKKSKLVENAVNRATQNVLQCFEIISLGGDC